MRQFAGTCEAVAATASKNEKVRLVGEYLRGLPVEDAARAAVFFTGRPYPRHLETTLAVGGALIAQAVAELAGDQVAHMDRVYRKYGDLGGMTQELLAQSRQDSAASVSERSQSLPYGDAAAAAELSLHELQQAFDELARRRGPLQKRPVLLDLLRRAEPLEAKYIVKIITGDMRMGLRENLVEEAIAAGYGRPLADVQRANMMLGDIGETLRLAADDRLEQACFRLFHPLGFMLAMPADTAAEAIAGFPVGALIEDKYDGIRAQVHKGERGVKMFSRTLDEIAEFPELTLPIAGLPGQFILDGEILAWRDGRALPFHQLQKRLGRKRPEASLMRDVPVVLQAFDVLYLDGELLLDLPLVERRRRLEALLKRPGTPVAGGNPAVQLAPARLGSSADDVQQGFDAALLRGNEGVMLKAPDSPYAPGRRGQHWRKLKAPLATLDVVVTAVEYGHGKRAGILSDYTFSVRDGERLVTIGKAYSGLTDAEIFQLTDFFKRHTIRDEGFRRQVEPLLVIEVAFNNIQRSGRHESGYALRFPRIIRLRPDKPVSEIDTLDRVRQLWEKLQGSGDRGPQNGQLRLNYG